MRTRITDMFGIKYPIVQGGLAHLAYSDLAAAVSNAGGLGQITAMSLPSHDVLRNEIRKVRKLTDKPFSVNFAIGQHRGNDEQKLQVAIEEQVKIISITGGNPAPIVEKVKPHGIKTLVLISSVKQAMLCEEIGVDAVMAVGSEGGGHLGIDDVSTFVLIPRVVESVNIPVIGSGGIGDGRGFLAALSLGAEGIEMGTRFIATQECINAHENYKNALIKAKETDTKVIKRSIRAPARALNTPYIKKIEAEELKNTGYEGLKDMISGVTNKKFAVEGDIENGFVWAGQVVGLINDIPSVSQLFQNMVNQFYEGHNRIGLVINKEETV